jgi:hypothetical protein
MVDLLRFARDLATDVFRTHLKLVAENALLGQQLIVAERKVVGRPRWKPWERYAMALATRFDSVPAASSRRGVFVLSISFDSSCSRAWTTPLRTAAAPRAMRFRLVEDLTHGARSALDLE